MHSDLEIASKPPNGYTDGQNRGSTGECRLISTKLVRYPKGRARMVRLNKMTDYGVVVLTQLARRRDQVLTATEIAKMSGVPGPTVAKLLKQLSGAGLVASRRGAGGGYALARSSREISVANVIDALEGPITLAACVEGSLEHCEIESVCPMCGNWNPVNQVIRRALEEVSLEEMAAPVIPTSARAGAGLGPGPH